MFHVILLSAYVTAIIPVLFKMYKFLLFVEIKELQGRCKVMNKLMKEIQRFDMKANGRKED